MAISYIIGNPGSGKTYFAVFKLYEYFIVPKLPKKKILGFELKTKVKEFNYLWCYTNINQFNFSVDERLLKFDFELFYLSLCELYRLYSNGASDEELNFKANELKLFRVMFVIDEVHNIFKNKDDKVLVWWLTYHRHMHQELIFITQDLSLISNEYKRIAEFFYKALDSSKRLFKTKLRYVQFSSYKMYKKDLVPGGAFSLPLNKEVFNLYQSGKDSTAKPFIHKIVITISILSLVLILAFFWFKSFFVAESDNNISLETNLTTLKIDENSSSLNKALSSLNDFNISHLQIEPFNKKSKKISDNNASIYLVTCSGSYCKIRDKDDNAFLDIPRPYFMELLNDTEPIYKFVDDNSGLVKKYFIVYENAIFENLKKGVKNEKTTSSGGFNLPNSLL